MQKRRKRKKPFRRVMQLFAPSFEFSSTPPPDENLEWDDDPVRRCVGCDMEFRAIRRNSRYCSPQCYRKTFYAKRKAAGK